MRPTGSPRSRGSRRWPAWPRTCTPSPMTSVVTSTRAPGSRLLPDSAVSELAHDVGVPGVAGGFVDHVDHDPAEAARLDLAESLADILDGRAGDDLARSRDLP